MIGDIKPQPADGFAWVDMPAGPALVCRPLEAFAQHLFTTRSWPLGSLAPDEPSREAAWSHLASSMASDSGHLARLHQVHGANVVVRLAPDADEPADNRPSDRPPDADIIVSDNPALVLAIQTADCLPMLMADTRTGAIAAAHAGWRGLALRVPQIAVQAMVEHFGSRPEDLIVAIGPSISADRYEVGQDVRAAMDGVQFGEAALARWFPAETRAGHWLFDGWSSAEDQLVGAGVAAARIHTARLCTATYPDLFCSYRRDGMRAGRLAAAVRASRSRETAKP